MEQELEKQGSQGFATNERLHKGKTWRKLKEGEEEDQDENEVLLEELI